MAVIYNFGIHLYYFLILCVSLFNKKAKAWIDGRKEVFTYLNLKISANEPIVWFHCASLGEFEQGRPLIEKIKKEQPRYKILLTFFSPSGYLIRKNYEHTDYVCYLPIDTIKNATRFIEKVNPEKVFFVKYEYWYNYIKVLNIKKIETYNISAIFRPNQLFFKPYGGWYKNILNFFTAFFVQDENSKILLNHLGFNNVEISGDTRFDRVKELVQNAPAVISIEPFIAHAKVIVAGSTWQPDEDIIFQYFNQLNQNIKLIIAPHEISESNINRMIQCSQKRTVRYSQLHTMSDFDVLIIDNIGMLSSLYRYAYVAYIGGGFGKGIHNVLEAVTYGVPVVFGPNYLRFKEAVDLISLNVAFSVENYQETHSVFEEILFNESATHAKNDTAKKYISDNIGATNFIYNKTF